MKYIPFLTLFFLATISFAQQRVDGYVKDGDNDSIIPYCHVYIDSTSHGTVSDSNGYFDLEIPDSLSHLDLIVKTLGYQNYVGKLSELAGDTMVINLKKKLSNLPVFEISASREKKLETALVGSKKKKSNGGYLLIYGYEAALFFDNKKGNKGYISKVKFFILKKGFPDTPFRVRVYEADSISGRPGREILEESITASGTTGNEWVIVDLLNQGIKIPKNGFFVAMEWLPISNEKEYQNRLHPTAGGQSLGATREFKAGSLTWIRNFLNDWEKAPIYYNNKYLNVLIAADLLIYK